MKCSHSKLGGDGRCVFCFEQIGMDIEDFALSDNEFGEEELEGLHKELSGIRSNAKNRIELKHTLKRDFLFNFSHLHSQGNLDTILQAVGGVKSSQGTLAVWIDGGDAPNVVCFSGSSAAITEYIKTKYDTYVYVDNLRQIYGEGHHIHAEMHLLADRLNAGSCQGAGVIVSKPCCPVCRSVLEAFEVAILDDGTPDLESTYSNEWRNPWSYWKETKATLEYRAKATKAALKHKGNVKLLGCDK